VEELSFEAAFSELEATVRRLEEGNLPLDEALALYERGVVLSRMCTQHLDVAEHRVEQLSAALSDEASGLDGRGVTDHGEEPDWED
jgi:exodeoxyribonuclease VII small subunit